MCPFRRASRHVLLALFLGAYLPFAAHDAGWATDLPAQKQKGSGEQLVDAAREGDLGQVKKLIDLGVDVNAQVGGQTALHAAVAFNKLAVVKELLRVGAKLNVEHYLHGTPLGIAATLGHADIAKELIKAGADVNAGSVTPLASAAAHGQTEVIKVLLGAGAKINTLNHPPLHGAKT